MSAPILNPAYYPRSIVTVTRDAGEPPPSWTITYDCGHAVIVVVWPQQPAYICGECLNQHSDRMAKGVV